ncbi:hypothetical protein MRB53_005684 [Persea americana]|uniref:Uncharacterized protein n=1 Tax=Persea americana TaxID=3435 RepID=A0ACC2ME73_PERAE|nr:hypothetical protein MRB53_005684 [Persea americana]
MSWSSFKETLKPCISSSSSSHFHSSTSEVDPPFQRKPPKSSLSQQLQRLQEDPPPHLHTLLPNNQGPKEKDHQIEHGDDGDGDGDGDGDDDDGDPIVPINSERAFAPSGFHTDPSGPYEPLILSADGETPVIQVPASINCRLLQHQREGVRFLYNLYKRNHGGVLGDDMGLGKTIQSIAFLSAVLGKDEERGDNSFERDFPSKRGPVLIVCPTSVINNWENEFSEWGTFSVAVYHGPNRDLILKKLEAGTREHFRDFYDEPLKHGQRSSAPERSVQIADKRKRHLVSVLHKYLLRRTKEETIGHLMMGKEDNAVFCVMSEVQKRVYRRMLELPDIQCLTNKDRPCSCGSPLSQVECCNRIVPDGIIWSYLHRDNPDGCDSCPFCLVLPCLIKLQQISNHLELIKPNPRDDIEKQRKDAELASAVFGDDIDLVGGTAHCESFMGLSDVEHCGKMRALEKLMLTWVSKGDKILLFSYSVRMLDILEKFLIRKGYSSSRLDGSTPMNCRQSLVDEFNSSPSKQVFLISTRAGGLGLNLVSANRVVIFDPNWNPAQDLQAQDRSFRYGQKRHVTVFRLLAAGSLEELVYSRQIYKQQLSNIAVSGKMEKRYFEGVQDCKHLQGELFGICNLFRDLSDKLFTSEIIELHEKRGLECRHFLDEEEHPTEIGECPTNKKSLINDNFDYPFSVQGNEEFSSGSRVGKSCDKGMAEIKKPILENLGIVYTHRNEDVVNAGPVNPSKEDTTSCEFNNNSIVKKQSRERDVFGKKSSKDEVSPNRRQKKSSEFGFIAQFMGMGKLEFSKWLLSASPSQREKVLQEYKNHKQREKLKGLH